MDSRQGPATVRFGPPLTPVVKVFLIICAAVFGVEFLVREFLGDQALYGLIMFFGLVPERVIHGFIWQPLSFNFFHANFLHLFFNLFAIWMFGADLERTLGPRRTIVYFAITGVGAGLLNLAAMPLMQREEWMIPAIGASGIAYGVLFAFAYLWPRRQILLFFVIPIQARWMVIIFGAIELVFSLRMIRDQGGSGIGHIAHLGGMLFGFLYLRYSVLYHRLREVYYRRKLKRIKDSFKVIDGGRDDRDDGPTIH
ncbi:MAG: rhomboid family intramembrane serine protease [Candidatus Alcyoniella australis]|nr:rhomboid family intramembrane serine protease [Candidatus Alcyoniella australis]